MSATSFLYARGRTADGGAVLMAASAALKVDITYASIKETKTKIIGM